MAVSSFLTNHHIIPNPPAVNPKHLSCFHCLLAPVAVAGAFLSSLAAAPAADSLLVWEWRNPLPQGNTLFNVVQTEDTLLAVGSSGTIFIREDDLLEAVESGTSGRFEDVLWWENGDESGFIAVGGHPHQSGRQPMERVVATSPDGLSWEISQTLDVPGFRSTAWNGEYFGAADIAGVFRSANETSHLPRQYLSFPGAQPISQSDCHRRPANGSTPSRRSAADRSPSSSNRHWPQSCLQHRRKRKGSRR